MAVAGPADVQQATNVL